MHIDREQLAEQFVHILDMTDIFYDFPRDKLILLMGDRTPEQVLKYLLKKFSMNTHTVSRHFVCQERDTGVDYTSDKIDFVDLKQSGYIGQPGDVFVVKTKEGILLVEPTDDVEIIDVNGAPIGTDVFLDTVGKYTVPLIIPCRAKEQPFARLEFNKVFCQRPAYMKTLDHYVGKYIPVLENGDNLAQQFIRMLQAYLCAYQRSSFSGGQNRLLKTDQFHSFDGYDFYKIRNDDQRPIARRFTNFIIVKDAEVVGLCHSGNRYIHPDHRGKGLGVEMLKAVDGRNEMFFCPVTYSEDGYKTRILAHRAILEAAMADPTTAAEIPSCVREEYEAGVHDNRLDELLELQKSRYVSYGR